MNCKSCKYKSLDSAHFVADKMWYCNKYNRHIYYALVNQIEVDKRAPAELAILKRCGFEVKVK